MKKKSIFKDKTAVVTGAASGLGYGIAGEILKRGGSVALLDIDKVRLDQAAVSFSEYKKKVLVKVCDVSDSESVKECIHATVRTFGRLDFLFNNAGLGGTLPIEEASLDHWNKIIDLNLKGVIHGITHVLPIMKKQQSGHIINTSSISGIIPYAGQSLYNTTKFAVTGLSLSLKDELRKDTIYISVLCPGAVKTRIFYKPIIGDEAREEEITIPKYAISLDEALADIINSLEKRKTLIITPKWLKGIYYLYRLTGKIFS